MKIVLYLKRNSKQHSRYLHCLGYMLQLVEVQQLRGAVGGDLFCCSLTEEPPVKRESKLFVTLCQTSCIFDQTHVLPFESNTVIMNRFRLNAGSDLASLDGGITPLPIAGVTQMSVKKETSMRFDFSSSLRIIIMSPSSSSSSPHHSIRAVFN